MRKFILIASMVLVSATAYAGPGRGLTLASSEEPAAVEQPKAVEQPTAVEAPKTTEAPKATEAPAYVARPAAIDQIVSLLKPVLCDREGHWTADYVRLRFLARRRQSD